MPIKKSALKALRQTRKRTLINRKIKENIKQLEKETRRVIVAKNKEKALAFFRQLTKSLDKAVKVNALKKNTVAHYKSRLQKAVNKIS